MDAVNVIYSFEEFKTIILNKAEIGAYYLSYDDFYFERIDKDTNIIRDALSVSSRYAKSFNVIKYINFRCNKNYTTKEIWQFIKVSLKDIKILLIIFNPNKEECFLLFIGNKNDKKIQKEIQKLYEMGQ